MIVLAEAAIRRTRKDERRFTYTAEADRIFEHATQRGNNSQVCLDCSCVHHNPLFQFQSWWQHSCRQITRASTGWDTPDGRGAFHNDETLLFMIFRSVTLCLQMQAEHERRMKDIEIQLRGAETAVVEWIQQQFSSLQAALSFHATVPAIE